MRSLEIQAPAKVNLFLRVGPTRPDGYHAVQTILHTLELADTVVLRPAEALTLTCDMDLGIPAPRNLAYRAAQAFSSAFEVDVLLDIQLVKRIPSGAGLGGGSSDAAAVLTGLAYWSGLPLDNSRLLGVARDLGADVSFLLEGGAALMGGRGDELVRRFKPIEAHVALLKPPASVPTADAYRAFDAIPTSADDDPRRVADALRGQNAVALGAALANNMTAASASLVPEIGEALAWLDAQDGVLGSAMAGSGSAVFALCRDVEVADRVRDHGRERDWWSATTTTIAHGAVVGQGDEIA